MVESKFTPPNLIPTLFVKPYQVFNSPQPDPPSPSTPTGSRMCTLICQSITTIHTKEKGRRIIEVAEILLDRPAASEVVPSPQPQFAIEVSPESDFWDFFQPGERYELRWRGEG